jgi:succinate-acetate transporter protein
MNNRAVITTTVGYMCWALMAWMVSVPGTALLGGDAGQMMHGATAMAYPLAIVLAVMGVFACLQGRSLDSIVFFGGTALFWTEGMMATTGMGMSAAAGYFAWYNLVWAVFFAYVGFASMKADMLRMLFLYGLALDFLLSAISLWGGGDTLMMIGNYIGLLVGIVAILISARAVMDHGAGGDPNRAG